MDPIVSRDFASPDALRKYLHEHPNADKKLHHVVKDDGGRGSGAANVKTKVDKSVAEEIGKVWNNQPSGNAVDVVRKMIEEDREVPLNLLDRAVTVLHDHANKPNLSKEDAHALRSLRDKLKSKAQVKDASMETIAQRVAGTFLREVQGFGFSREFYLPPSEREKPPTVPEGTDLAIWTWDGERDTPRAGKITVFYGICFAGKANKPLWNYAFRTESNRNEEVRKTVEIRKQFLDRKKREQEEKNNFVHGLKPGDIMVCSWGYDQTNIDFYQITEVRGKNVIIREIGKKVVRDSGQQEVVMPEKDRFVGEPMTKRPGGSSGHPYVKVNSFSSAHLWDGQPEHQTNSMFGH